MVTKSGVRAGVKTEVKKTPVVLSIEETLHLKVRERTALFVAAGSPAVQDFCAYVAAGGHMAGYCQERGLKYHTVYDLIDENETYSQMYARAKLSRADVLADELVAISDEADVKAVYDGKEVTLALDSTAVARNRLRVDTRKWVAGKLRPAAYGEKTTTEITGAAGGPVQIAAVSLKGLNDAELKQMQELLARAAARLPPSGV